MRQLIYNLSIRGKILLGFFLVTAIFFVLGIFQYNSLEKVNQTNELITFAKDMNSTAAQIKYLIAKDMNVLRNFTFAKNEKELKVLHKEHADLYDKLNAIFSNTNNITANKNVDALLRHNFRDTIQSLSRLYINEFCVSFNEIYLGQKVIVNPAEIKNAIRQKEIATSTEPIQNDTLRHTAANNNDINFDEKSKEYVTELKNEQKKHYQIITKLNGDIDKMLTIVELKSNGLINKSMAESSTIGSSNINTMIIFMLIGIIVSIALAMYISSLIVKPLEKLMKYAKRLSEG